ncbi:MAG TPA: hypothetical protein DD727_01615, partial [Clostridiales bacterium]|nr:hypothetical protein [Clostridiales bacterium]
GTTKDDAINHANSWISSKSGSLGLNGVMWDVMKGMLMRSESDRMFTLAELTAWLLWEEASPRGPLSASDLGSATIGVTTRQLADLSLLEMTSSADTIFSESRLAMAKTRGEAIQAANRSRGGTYPPWSYIYRADRRAMEQARSSDIKRAAARGQDLVCFYGHGDPGGWAGALTDWVGSGSEVGTMNFGGRNPIVMAFACETGNYTIGPHTDPATGTVLNDNPSISECILQNGAAVYLGATEVMSYGQMDELITVKLWRYWSAGESIGDMMHTMKTDLTALGTWYHFIRYYNLYGDPKYGRR